MDKKTKKLLLLSALAGSTLLLTGLFTMATGDAGYVGSEKCKECHEDIAATHADSLHAKAWSGKGEGYGCETCHGPAGNHVNNPSRETIISFGKESKQDAEAQSAQCLSCHSASKELAMWDMGQHKKNDVACSTCHSVHKAAKPKVSDPETCFTCHKDIRSLANKFSHHPIIEGKIKCGDCHNTHGTLSHGMIRAENVNQLCYKCHPDKRGPYMWEHPPVEENCIICHDTHGSKDAKLMREKVPNICEDCHDWSRHPGTPYDAKNGFTGSAPSNRMFARSCNNCHTNIHGSNAPVNPASTYNSGKAFVR